MIADDINGNGWAIEVLFRQNMILLWYEFCIFPVDQDKTDCILPRLQGESNGVERLRFLLNRVTIRLI
jgi:hypothetical protein